MAGGKQWIYVIKVVVCHNTKLPDGTGDNMSYDEEKIREILKKRILPEFNETIDDVMKTVEIVNGMYVFVINSDGFAFIDNELVDVMPGWRKTEGVVR